MYTVEETPTFQRAVTKIWSDAERIEFISWIAANPLAGDLIRGSRGARKVRWSIKGQGRSGGARVVTVTEVLEGVVILVTIYAKSDRSTITPSEIERI